MNTDFAIETRGLSFAYGRRPVLESIDLAIANGSFYALLGANGVGKTTLLKILSGLLEPKAGAALVLGRDCRQLRPEDWFSIGYMSESQRIYDWMTGEELIAFNSGLYPNWDHAFCAQLVRQMQLPLAQKVRSYSKGQRMKMVLLLAIAYHPKVLLLDEPFSGLDVLAKEQLITCLLETTTQEQWAVLFASHDLAEVERLADNIGFIDGGRFKINESLESLQARFRRVEGFNLEGEPAIDASMWQVQKSTGRISFIETAFSEARERELRQRLGPKVEISPLALREITLAYLSHSNPVPTP